MDKSILFFKDIEDKDLKLVGGKGLNIGSLIGAGFKFKYKGL